MSGNRQYSAGYEMDDFPFYNGKPIGLSAGNWLLLMLGVALGFMALASPFPFGQYPGREWISAFLFPGIPMLVFIYLVGEHWRLIFAKVDAKAVGWMFLIALLNIIVSISIGKLVMDTAGAAANPVFGLLREQDSWKKILFLLRTIPQLFGEELITIFPFLAIMWLLHTWCGMSRKLALILA
ncbi:hypothetical protein [Cellvibrio sp. NN19]|uniref:hypothetical protein n=1 Tax=Cellvibrio chitinivorans TaxID=3102792 RepID=UPI002B415569|nr:hypothetical protein [Cellvibrio sp. NN19]